MSKKSQAKVKATEAKTKQAIRNVSALSNKQLKAKLEAKGIEVPKGAGRAKLITLARENGLWNYSGYFGGSFTAPESDRKGAV